MFTEILGRIEIPTDQLLWSSAMAGVQVCEFSCVFSETGPCLCAPGRSEALFCLDGALQIEQTSASSFYIHGRDILLLSDVCSIQSVSSGGEPVRGILVVVESAAARESLVQLCSLLGGLRLDPKPVGRLMRSHNGLARINGEAWSEALFSVLVQLPAPDRAQYCTLKTVELLYLLCSGNLAPAPFPAEHYYDRYQVQIVQQVSAFIDDHLSEDLSIARLAVLFHISPTELKTHFRQYYGLPLHQSITIRRMDRAAELLTTTARPVSVVAADVGYSSVSQFSAVFRQKHHKSPKEYRIQSKIV